MASKVAGVNFPKFKTVAEKDIVLSWDSKKTERFKSAQLPTAMNVRKFPLLEAKLSVDGQGVLGYDCFMGDLLVATILQRTIPRLEEKEFEEGWILFTMEGMVPFKHTFEGAVEPFYVLSKVLQGDTYDLD